MSGAAPRQSEVAGVALVPLLAELEQVLAEEAQALTKLDRERIDRAAERKGALCDDIQGARAMLGAEHRPALERIRKSALRNQILLAHARDTVRQVLGRVAGQSDRPSMGGLRLNVTG